MLNLKSIFAHKKTQQILWVFIFLFPLLFMWQGGDLTDTGYNLTVYHFFFDRLDNGITDSLIFLTELVGGTWLLLFPNLGVLGIKILAILFFYLNIILAKEIVQNVYPNNPYLPFFMLGAVIFSVRAFPIVFNYDVFTSSLLLCFIYLLRNKETALTYKNIIGLGFLVSIMTFARFPNIFLIVLFPICLFICKSFKLIKLSLKRHIRISSAFILSTLVCSIIILTLLYIVGYSGIYINNLNSFTSSFQESDNTYTLSYVLEKYAMDIGYFLIYALATFVLSAGVYFIQKQFKNRHIFNFIFLCGLSLLSLYPFVFNYNNSIKYILPALVLIVWLTNTKDEKVNYLYVLLILISLIQIAGSNTGIFLKIGLLSVLGFPLAMSHISEYLDKKNMQLYIPATFYVILVSGLIHMVFIYGVGSGALIRCKAIHPISSSVYWGMHSTLERSHYIQQIERDIRLHKDDNQTLFIYGHQPMIYYISDSEPALKEIWLIGNNLISLPDVFSRLDQLEVKPLFLDSKTQLFGADVDSLKEKYLKQNKYELVKSTQYYDIWNAKD